VRRLTQAQAALLLSRSDRWLRDRPDAPRNDDGTYPGPALIAWFLRVGGELAPLDDDAMETIMRLVEVVGAGVDNDTLAGNVAAKFAETRKAHGEAAAVFFVDLLASAFRAQAEAQPKGKEPETFEEWQRQVKEARAYEELRFVMRCETCHRIRHGRRWVEREPPEDHHPLWSTCGKDDCRPPRRKQ
jgi:hypothetical protein